MNHDTKKCTCPICSLKPGQVFMQVMIGHPTLPPQSVGTIEIHTDPLLVEDWMLEKVALDAVASLGKFIVQNNEDKVVN